MHSDVNEDGAAVKPHPMIQALPHGSNLAGWPAALLARLGSIADPSSHQIPATRRQMRFLVGEEGIAKPLLRKSFTWVVELNGIEPMTS